MTIYADTSRIDDIKYVTERIREADWDKENDIDFFDWLNPIREKLNA